LAWAPPESFAAYGQIKCEKQNKKIYPAFAMVAKPDAFVLAKKYFCKCSSFCSEN